METVFMNTKNSKANEPLKFVLDLSQRLHLKSSEKYFAKICLFLTCGKI